MPMVTTTGMISFLKVRSIAGSDYAFFELQDASTNPPTPETFFIWSGDPLPPGGPQWMQRSLQVSMVRDAIIAGKTISVYHDSTSSSVSSLGLNA
jgi:hypothetical protein